MVILPFNPERIGAACSGHPAHDKSVGVEHGDLAHCLDPTDLRSACSAAAASATPTHSVDRNTVWILRAYLATLRSRSGCLVVRQQANPESTGCDRRASELQCDPRAIELIRDGKKRRFRSISIDESHQPIVNMPVVRHARQASAMERFESAARQRGLNAYAGDGRRTDMIEKSLRSRSSAGECDAPSSGLGSICAPTGETPRAGGEGLGQTKARIHTNAIGNALARNAQRCEDL